MLFKNKKEPAIYIRFCNKVVMYIGETQDWRMGRPFRDGDDPKYKDKQLMEKLKLQSKEKCFLISTRNMKLHAMN